ncbi:vascular endothelial growth factor receptor 3 [Plakobranchus ocellatus]|uniref:Vascular endothelial growth factor receptor 3 n=1 Tax=Plakobranchus ocellatus TaxID=259542 RepID=A0AAV4A3Z5_9GAST|nr:vascular endothelial growth factor receptor 3 [Plakobranchus ocellatus]
MIISCPTVAPVQTEPGVVLETVPIGSSVTLTCAVTANPLPTYVWYKGADIISGAVGSTYTLQVDEDTDFGSYSCSAQNIEGTLNPAVEFSVQEGEPDVGASVGSDDGLSTATIILIVIIVVIFLIIVILIIIFCCMQGTCAKLCKKDTGTAKVAPTTYNGQPTPPVYMNGGSVPERQGPRAHYLPPLTSENDNNIDSYYREEKRRSRRKRKHRKHRQADDKNALTGVEAAEGGEGGSPTPRTDGGETTPGRSSRSYGGAADDTYQN